MVLHDDRLFIASRSHGLLWAPLAEPRCAALGPFTPISVPSSVGQDALTLTVEAGRLFAGFASGWVIDRPLPLEAVHPWQVWTRSPPQAGWQLVRLALDGMSGRLWAAYTDGIVLLQHDAPPLGPFTRSAGVDLASVSSLLVDDDRGVLWIGRSVAPLAGFSSSPLVNAWRSYAWWLLLCLPPGLIVSLMVARPTLLRRRARVHTLASPPKRSG